MFVHWRRRRVGLSPSRRVGCVHRGPGRQSLRPYLVRNDRHPKTGTVVKDYVLPLASTARSCCLEEDPCRACWLWVQVEKRLDELSYMAGNNDLSERFRGFDPADAPTLKRAVALVVPYPSPSYWRFYRMTVSRGWIPR